VRFGCGSRAPGFARFAIPSALRAITTVRAIASLSPISTVILPPRTSARFVPRRRVSGALAGIAQLVAMRRSERFRVARAALVVALADLVLEAVPLGLLGVLVLLPRIAMLTARPPVFVSRAIAPPGARARWTGVGLREPLIRAVTLSTSATAFHRTVAFGPWAFPAPLALTEPGVARLVARVEELATLEPFHDRRLILFAKAIERRQQFLGIVRPEGGWLVVDDDGPVGVARRHGSLILRRRATRNRRTLEPCAQVFWMDGTHCRACC
jgi:hypothetical protein